MATQPFGQALRELARLHTGGLRQHHGSVGREIAVARIARRLDGDAREVEALRQRARSGERAHLRRHHVMEMCEQVHHGLA